MGAGFLGFDHLDVRVPSLDAVEAFYDRLMPALGLPRKRHAHVDAAGDWHEPSGQRPYNTVEYHEERARDGAPNFIGFVEDGSTKPTSTRIAFRAAAPLDFARWESFLTSIGAAHVERSESDDYPAIFFEDPSGTKLEICARKLGVSVP